MHELLAAGWPLLGSGSSQSHSTTTHRQMGWPGAGPLCTVLFWWAVAHLLPSTSGISEAPRSDLPSAFADSSSGYSEIPFWGDRTGISTCIFASTTVRSRKKIQCGGDGPPSLERGAIVQLLMRCSATPLCNVALCPRPISCETCEYLVGRRSPRHASLCFE